MCKEDIDLEEIVRNNKAKIEEILRNEGRKAEGEHGEAHEGEPKFHAGGFNIDLGPMEKVGDAVKEIFSLILDPKVQIHFIKAGKEFFNGIEAMIKNAPLPDEMKETVNKAYEVKDKIIEDLANEFNPDAKKGKAKDKKMKKIDVE